MEVRAVLSGTLPHVTARFRLSFTGLGYAPPRLLFLKVQDAVDVEVTAALEWG
jgi:hypothetical protein